MADSAYLSIGEVLGILLDEFPDVTISKIRFLESQGLIEPERTPSGYRKFYDNDVDLLRAILREQKDNFLPLKVIRDRLESGEIEPDQTGAHTMPRGIRNVDLSSVDVAQSAPPRVALTSSAVAQSVVAEVSANSQPTPTAAHPTTPEVTATSPIPTSSRDSVFRRTDVVADSTPARPQTTERSSSPSTPPSTPIAQAATRALDHGPESGADVDAEPTVSQSVGERFSGARVVAPDQVSSEVERNQGPLTASELCVLAGISGSQLADLEQYGVVTAKAGGATTSFSVDMVEIARLAGRLLEQGVDARHLRGWRQSADREAALFEQLITPLLRQRNPQARRRAFESLGELADLGGDLRSALMASFVRGYSESN